MELCSHLPMHLLALRYSLLELPSLMSSNCIFICICICTCTCICICICICICMNDGFTSARTLFENPSSVIWPQTWSVRTIESNWKAKPSSRRRLQIDFILQFSTPHYNSYYTALCHFGFVTKYTFWHFLNRLPRNQILYESRHFDNSFPQ